MTSITTTRIISNAQLHCPGVLEDVVKRELYNVLDEFFDKSSIWQDDVTFKTKAARTNYPLSVDLNARVLRLIQVLDHNSVPVPASLLLSDTAELVLDRDPPEANKTWTATLALDVVLDPTSEDPTPVFPEPIVQRYLQPIMDGVVGRLMTHPAKPYSNERMAIYHMRRLRNGMSVATADALRRYTSRGAWSFPQTFSVRKR